MDDLALLFQNDFHFVRLICPPISVISKTNAAYFSKLIVNSDLKLCEIWKTINIAHNSNCKNKCVKAILNNNNKIITDGFIFHDSSLKLVNKISAHLNNNLNSCIHTTERHLLLHD